MSLQNTLITKLENIEPIEILRKIGYRNISDKTIARLKDVLASELLCLDKSGFDFKYSNIEFVKALCDLCNIEFNDFKEELEQLTNIAAKLNHAFRPYIFIYTGFKRASQSIIALAFLESRRHIYLPNEFKLESVESQIEYVKRLIVEHYKNENGVLSLWGDIENYVFNISENSYLTFNPQGVLIENKNSTQVTAKISLRNKDITTILKF